MSANFQTWSAVAAIGAALIAAFYRRYGLGAAVLGVWLLARELYRTSVKTG